MNDSEVTKQINQMVSFIKQEAKEKANEIRVKGEEEFSIAKAKIYQEEKDKINKEYERKEKQVTVSKRIAYSNELNGSRLKVFQEREKVLNEVKAESLTALAQISSASTYPELLYKLTLQGVIRLQEPSVLFTAKSSDSQIILGFMDRLKKEYSDKTKGITIQLEFDSQRSLPPNCAGGVIVSALGGRILCNNTLEARLAISFEQNLPSVRTTLFGRSTTRKFID